MLFIDLIVDVAAEPGNDLVDPVVLVGGFFARPEMISGVRASSIRIESTSSTIAKLMVALNAVREVELHVVAQIIEAELVVGSVGDVGAIRLLAFADRPDRAGYADRQSEKLVEPAHPFRVASGQVIVDGNDVDAFAFKRIQIGGQRGDQRFSFTGLHLGDLALVQHIAADQLHVEVPHVQDALAGFARYRECFGKDVVERTNRSAMRCLNSGVLA